MANYPSYNPATPYAQGDILNLGDGTTWEALKGSTGVAPGSDTATWQEVAGSADQVYAETSVVVTTATYQAEDGDIVLADATAQPIVVTAPKASPTARFTVVKTDVSVNAVTVVGLGAATVAPAVSLATQGAAKRLRSGGTNWTAF